MKLFLKNVSSESVFDFDFANICKITLTSVWNYRKEKYKNNRTHLYYLIINKNNCGLSENPKIKKIKILEKSMGAWKYVVRFFSLDYIIIKKIC